MRIISPSVTSFTYFCQRQTICIEQHDMATQSSLFSSLCRFRILLSPPCQLPMRHLSFCQEFCKIINYFVSLLECYREPGKRLVLPSIPSNECSPGSISIRDRPMKAIRDCPIAFKSRNKLVDIFAN